MRGLWNHRFLTFIFCRDTYSLYNEGGDDYVFNIMNSWDKSDSTFWGVGADKTELGTWYEIGEHDHSLMQKLSDAGTEHRKYVCIGRLL